MDLTTENTSNLMDLPTSSIPFELASLANAANYQRWVFQKTVPYLGQRIIEIGAGIGNMSQWLPVNDRLILSEFDPALMGVLKQTMKANHLDGDNRISVISLDVEKGDISSLVSEGLDTVISFNVLEHIENDELALDRLCQLVRSTRSQGPKRVITFVPAHQWAFGSMDRTFGHYRRYSKRKLEATCRRVAPTAKISVKHFNLFGLVGWIWNGKLLKKESIGAGSIQAFEKLCPYLIPVDNFLHRTLHLPIGQSLLAVIEWP